MTYIALVNALAMLATVAAITRLVVARADREPYGRAALLLLGAILLMGFAGLTRRVEWSQADGMVAVVWTVVAFTALTVAVWRLTPHD